MNFNNAKKFGGLKKLNKDIHWEVCKEPEASKKYVVKEETRIDGPYEFGIKPMNRASAVDWEEVK